MAVRKLESGLWVADVTLGKRLDGTRDRRQPQFSTKAKAENEERRLLALKEIRRGKSYGGIPFGEFVEQYFWPQKEGLRYDTKRCYRRDLNNRILPAFGPMPMEDINRFDVQKMIDGCPTKKVATNARETASSVFSLACEMQVLTFNPASCRFRYPAATKHPKNEGGAWLSTFAEIQRVLDFMAEHYPDTPEERICLLGLGYGLRKGEVFAADCERRSAEDGGLCVEQTCVRKEGGAGLDDPKTPAGFREVPAFRYLRERLGEILKGESGPIVKGRGGERMKPQTGYKRIDKVFNAGLRFDDGEPLPHITIFSMRHSFGTACIDAGIEVAKLAKWMGHADVSTTYNRYVKPRLKDLKRDTALIDRAFDEAL